MNTLTDLLAVPMQIVWDPNPELFRIFDIPLRYYGLLWGVGIILASLVVHYQFKDKKIPDKKFEPLFFYCFFGIMLGSRLGHVIFYQPELFIESPLEVLLPIDIDALGKWHFKGYSGLASHGGTLGLIIALWLYVRKTKLNFVDVLDMIAVATPIAACCIRLANLMNSEIIGKPTDVPWAFIFVNNPEAGMVPRHPAQLYEALAYLLFFFIMIFLYKKYNQKLHRGFFFGLCLTLIFVFRFFIEYIKEDQVAFEAGMTLNMGQWLSIPFIIIGLGCIFAGKRLDKMKPEIKRK